MKLKKLTDQERDRRLNELCDLGGPEEISRLIVTESLCYNLLARGAVESQLEYYEVLARNGGEVPRKRREIEAALREALAALERATKLMPVAIDPDENEERTRKRIDLAHEIVLNVVACDVFDRDRRGRPRKLSNDQVRAPGGPKGTKQKWLPKATDLKPC